MSSAVVVSSENLDEKQQSVSTPVVHAADKKVNLLGMSRAELEKFFEDLGCMGDLAMMLRALGTQKLVDGVSP